MNGKRLTTIALIFMSMMAIITVACTPTGSEPEETAVSLQDHTWILQQLNGTPPLEGSFVSIEFDGEQAAGSAGCNRYFGGYTIDGNNISFDGFGMTEMFCPDTMDQETSYITTLQSATAYTLTAEQLTIQTNNGDLVFAPAVDSTLENVDWVLAGISQGDAIVTTALDQEIMTRFEDGTVSGQSTCNSFTGDYAVNGNQLEIEAIAATLRACAEAERNERESEFLSAWNNVDTFNIEMNTLTLFDEGGRVLMVFMTK